MREGWPPARLGQEVPDLALPGLAVDDQRLVKILGEDLGLAQLREPLPVLVEHLRRVALVDALEDVEVLCP
jgi:hypothetical protein